LIAQGKAEGYRFAIWIRHFSLHPQKIFYKWCIIRASRPSGVYLNFHPKIAPKKAAILPLTAKDGHPEKAERLYMELREDYPVDLDIKQNIGKRYARQDEIGTPFCFTIDNTTMKDDTVTVRERNTMSQERIGIDRVSEYLAAHLKVVRL
jgi:glycyl-tRNA synthetase